MLQGEQNPPAQLRCVVDLLQAGRERLPFVMPEIGMTGTGRHDEVIVGNASVFQHHFPALLVDIDKERREVVLEDRRIPYDYLVVATGARHAYFGHDEWEPFAPGLKKIDDATELRRRILLALEHAETAMDEESRKRLLTFVVIGGGPTGVEM